MLSGVGHAFREREQGEEVGQAERKVWEWRNDLEVSYVQRGTQGPPLLLVPGFGVGSFHYERSVATRAHPRHRDRRTWHLKWSRIPWCFSALMSKSVPCRFCVCVCARWSRNLERLSKTHRVWAVDLLGQGKSWPKVMPSEDQRLAFSVDTWREQLHAFVT